MRRAFAVIKGGRNEDASATRKPGSAAPLPECRMGPLAEIEILKGKADGLLTELYAARKAGDKQKTLQLASELLDARLELVRKMRDEKMADELGGQLVAAAQTTLICQELSDGMQKEHFAGIMRESAVEYLRLEIRQMNGELASSIVRPYLSFDEITRLWREERKAGEIIELNSVKSKAGDE